MTTTMTSRLLPMDAELGTRGDALGFVGAKALTICDQCLISPRFDATVTSLYERRAQISGVTLVASDTHLRLARRAPSEELEVIVALRSELERRTDDLEALVMPIHRALAEVKTIAAASAADLAVLRAEFEPLFLKYASDEIRTALKRFIDNHGVGSIIGLFTEIMPTGK